MPPYLRGLAGPLLRLSGNLRRPHRILLMPTLVSIARPGCL
jgi:hypothetical protein